MAAAVAVDELAAGACAVVDLLVAAEVTVVAGWAGLACASVDCPLVLPVACDGDAVTGGSDG